MVTIFVVSVLFLGSKVYATDYSSPNFSLRDPVISGTTVQDQGVPPASDQTSASTQQTLINHQSSVNGLVVSLIIAVLAVGSLWWWSKREMRGKA